MTSLDRAIAGVVDNGNCSGCGACTLLDTGLSMQLDAAGFNRPVRTGTGVKVPSAAQRFRLSCPGSLVTAQRPPGARWHPTMGPVIQAWKAWATDPDLRYRGSSGGVITAITAWLVETGQSSAVVGAAPLPAEPRRTTTVTIRTRAQAAAAAGSRYGPVSNAGNRDVPYADAIIGKPCEISAIRALSAERAADPLLISFFCAGVPSQHATDALVERLGIRPGARLKDLWYRGHGWPGRFTAVPARGEPASASYEESWGEHLGPTIQWRCKICPDGVGESSDLTAADFWDTDERGYPTFSEADGTSAIIARTARGYQTVLDAIRAGVIAATPVDVDALARVQPLQRNRRELLAGRLAGTLLGGRAVPRYRGFSLLRLALARPADAWRTARGTLRRVRESGRADHAGQARRSGRSGRSGRVGP